MPLGPRGEGMTLDVLEAIEPDTLRTGEVVSFAAQVVADCAGTPPPGCGCASGSTGRTFLQLFDMAPTDCAITVAEVSGNALIQSLFAPDVTIKGQSALSIGFGVTAVQAAFEP